MTGTLFETHGTSRTFIKIELVSIAWPEFDDGILRARPVATIAFKAVAA
jgi:hypothetical protein